MNLTFTRRFLVTFPPTTPQTELLAVLPVWQGSMTSPSSLALQLSPRMGKWQGRWLCGMASGSIPPFLAWWKGRDGESSLSEHWSRASPPLATVRAKGQLRPMDESCVHIRWSNSFSHPGSESLSLWSVLPPTHGCHMRMAIPLSLPWWFEESCRLNPLKYPFLFDVSHKIHYCCFYRYYYLLPD